MQADDVKLLGDDTYSLAISPNGKYVVGYNPSKIRSGVGTESFVYNVGSGALKQPIVQTIGKPVECLEM
mgnify:CR=1 FL=1